MESWRVGGSLAERLHPIYQLHVDVEHNATRHTNTGKPQSTRHEKSLKLELQLAVSLSVSPSQSKSNHVPLIVEKLQMPYCQNNNNSGRSYN